ncbi:MAG: hypothetical protein IJB75_03220 [Oscillospiraceae bacterium]|nr:hypothetical protein [Oscillospiraceae bacterium]
MELSLAIIFGFVVFMIILNDGRLIFFSVSSLLVIAAISFGIGYGMAFFVLELLGPVLKIALIGLALIIGIALLGNLLGKGG